MSIEQGTINNVAIALGAVMLAYNAAMATRRDKKLSQVAKTTEAIHVLSNSAMGAQLKLNVDFAMSDAVTKHRISLLTKEEGDVAAAAAADIQVAAQLAILQTHVLAQSKVDAQVEKEKK